jgi:prepilin peptidase CpaA
VPFVFATLALLVIVVWRDITTRTIPDEIALLLVMTGALARLLQGPSALAASACAALLLFAMLMVLFSRGFIGGGDVKVMAALATGLSPFDSYCFVVATALAGGILAIVYLLLPHLLRATRQAKRKSLLGRVMSVEAWRIRRRGPLPYGVAIAAGAAFVVLFHPGSL